ncbi:MAG: DUF4118 domain-containing protein [Propionibacteriaceae bacterium]|jgi:two-component system sensor histidine kinase KdpD|nr:DUF4118 domain-containing protein [Propionibacteriaceae bacterium]
MDRGRLRVLLGAAPGVGKTYAMLDEGRGLKASGKDVVVAVVETHGRPATAAQTRGLEILPRKIVVHRGIELTDMDTDAVIARRPDIALVDELAHTNAPGMRHDKRWEDVEDLLAAGIDVITTVNIQHIESMNDVVEEITGVAQHETIPDGILRAADQVEVVDLAPQALRDRLSAGYVYPAERVDAALSNYFRVGNLTALRELALLWVADEVDTALKKYRTEHGIAQQWEARERVVVALGGASEGEMLLRRGARIASRSVGGELMAVHVVSQDGLSTPHPGVLAAQRALIEHLGGTYHQVVGDDIPGALVEFAKAAEATQLVVGCSHRHWALGPLVGRDIGMAVIRDSGTIDVHIVNTSVTAVRLALPRLGGAMSLRRILAGFLVTLAGGPLLTWLLRVTHPEGTIAPHVLAFQVLVVVAAVIGGLWPALAAAVMSGLLLNYFFVAATGTFTIQEPSNLITLALYVLVAVLVSFVVGEASRRSRQTRRTAAESELLAAVAGSVMRGQDAVQAILERISEAFRLDGVRLRAGDTVLGTVGEVGGKPPTGTFPVGERAVLEVRGPDLTTSERRLMAVLVSQLDAALEVGDLAKTASEVEPLAASERVRTALLAALSHDLRRPIASATAAVSGLKAMGADMTQDDREELLSTATESLDALAELVNDLLDVSKLQAGALVIATTPVDVDDAIAPALDELRLDAHDVELDLGDVPPAMADPVLLQRVIVNLLLNALRYAPKHTKVRLATSAFGGNVEVRITDHGPGVPPERVGAIFVPFQREGDTDNTKGLGLGLALSKGFVEAMGGTLTPEDTPGGGLTMVVSLAAAVLAAGSPGTPDSDSDDGRTDEDTDR